MIIDILIILLFTISGYILNRLRGKSIITIKDQKISGMFIYAIAIGVFTYFITCQWYYGLLGVGLFVLGESCTWGNSISVLRKTKLTALEEYDYKNSDRGKSFPWLFYPANDICNRDNDLISYSIVYLWLRSVYWFGTLIALWCFAANVSVIQAVLSQLVLCFSWPCISTVTRDHGLQEKVYGAVHGLCFGMIFVSVM